MNRINNVKADLLTENVTFLANILQLYKQNFIMIYSLQKKTSIDQGSRYVL